MTRFLCVLTSVVLASAACGNGERLAYADADSGSEALVNSGDEFEIRLESNRSTGYLWELVADATPGVVQLQSAEYDEPSSDLVGAPGTQIFTYEAIEEGATILRFSYLRSDDGLIIPERVFELIVRVDGAPWRPEDPGDPPDTTSVSVPEPPSDAIHVTDLFDGEGPRQATVEGLVVWDQASARLCEVLMESYPPQCGGLAVVIANPEGLDVELQEAQGIRWTDSSVELTGLFDGNRLVLDDESNLVEPTSTDEALVNAFLNHAAAPSSDTAAALPFAAEVGIGLGRDVLQTVPVVDLGNADFWQMRVDEYQGFGGPFSALDTAKGPVMITVGAHPHCAGPPVAAPSGFEESRRLSMQPQDATSCIEWWTVDFFLDPDGNILAVTLDLFGP